MGTLGTAPNGEQCKTVKGGDSNGPEVWPLSNSFWIAAETAVGLFLADNKFRCWPRVSSPQNPMSKPKVNPCNKN